ncbi:pickpocket protein 28-like [Neocloeon triangulifer]|uniref:pickpocket protein 28-like n=1 Tax=Neocloeon triangulifer TaxID=2078957 RepID=UPI00286EE408|nr:pickpocket protein 28-like [Neocloeon triangulifer]
MGQQQRFSYYKSGLLDESLFGNRLTADQQPPQVQQPNYTFRGGRRLALLDQTLLGRRVVRAPGRLWDPLHGWVDPAMPTQVWVKKRPPDKREEGESEWPIGKVAKEFCEDTSLHGVQYLAGNFLFERIFWAFALLLALAGAGLLIREAYQKWVDAPVILSFSTISTSVAEIPFPAFTVCNMNNARKGVAERVLNSNDGLESERDKILLEDFCSVDTAITFGRTEPTERVEASSTEGQPFARQVHPRWSHIKEFLVRSTQPCHEMLVACAWLGLNRNCSNLFNTALTDEGLCCSFNKVPRDFLFRNPRDLSDLNVTFPFPAVDWTPEDGYPNNHHPQSLPWRAIGAGKHLGLTVVLDCEKHEYFCSSTASLGFKLLLHSPVETPKLQSFGFAVRPGSENFISIQPKVRKANPAVISVPLSKRNCYFASERYLRFYRTYTQHNCIQECEANYTVSICGCVLFYMAKDQDVRICGKRDYKCAQEARANMELSLYGEAADQGGPNRPSCRCLPGCSEISYSARISSSALTDSFSAKERFTPLSDHPVNITYFKENYAIVHLYFSEPEVTAYELNEINDYVGFLSNTGGLLGLFHGFSILSLIEILYFMSVRLLGARRARQKKVRQLRAPRRRPFSFVN